MCEKNEELEVLATSAILCLNDADIIARIKTFEAAPDMLKEYQKKADLGDAEAMYQIAQMYLTGLMIPADEKKDGLWFLNEAAALGHIGAMMELGKRYLEEAQCNYKQGEEAESVCLQKAVTAYEKAADMGSAAAMRALGEIFAQYGDCECVYEGRRALKGIEQDIAKGIQWYEKAAEQGDALSMLSLGWIYRTENDYMEDAEKAFEWYQKAAATDQKIPAMLNLGEMYERGEGTQRDMAKAIECYMLAAESEPHAMAALARIYQEGDGVPKDSAKAVEWLEKAAAADHYYAIVDLALMYIQGSNVPQDRQKGSALFAEARCNERKIDPHVLFDIGRIYFEHDDSCIPENKKRAYRIFKESSVWNASMKGLHFLYRAAALGSVHAITYLGSIYQHGESIIDISPSGKMISMPRNLKKALAWYQMTIAFSSLISGSRAFAMYEIGNIYYMGGEGVAQDFEKAFTWYQRAAKDGEKDATLKLAEMYEKGEGVGKDMKKAETLRKRADIS